ncbi:MAG: glycoside hydrolase family 38 C-terminal domain-containing protein [Terriglobia bacterium]
MDPENETYRMQCSSALKRREFLRLGLVGGSSAFLLPGWPQLLAASSATGQGICLALGNHWSYIGIGWQLGLESCALSAIDAIGMADLPPHVKTCINLDARAYELIAERYPELSAKLKKYLSEGKAELIGGTYAQAMGSYISGESNLRQIVIGRKTIKKALDYDLATFLEEEEFTHPQLPQLLVGAEFRYASLAQVDTWGRAGIPVLELNVLNWKGLDGTVIPSMPKNSLFSFGPQDIDSIPGLKELQKLGKPLMVNWAEFGWEPHELPAYLSEAKKYEKFSKDFPIEYVTLKEYMEKYGQNPEKTIYLNMDSWVKLLPWGIGGDQLRVLDRKVEAILHAAERFDAIASSLGERPKIQQLEAAWKNLLTAQSHDVSLCEFSRWQSDRMAPLDRSEDFHNFTWGTIGYNHLSAAQNGAQEILDASLSAISGRINAQSRPASTQFLTVFNPSGWDRTEVITTGRIYPPKLKAKNVVVKDDKGRVIPHQIVKSERDEGGNLQVATLAFQAGAIPSVGYANYSVEFTNDATPALSTDLRLNLEAPEMENEFLKVALNQSNGAIASLVDKKTGREMLDGKKCSFPIFRGRPNPDFPLRSAFVKGKYPPEAMKIPASFDSSQSAVTLDLHEGGAKASSIDYWKASLPNSIRWIEKGPVRATIKASHYWPLLKFEIYVTLSAHTPWVEVVSRVLAEIPPALDMLDKERRFPAEIKEGYWLNFAPAFTPTTIRRDFPFGVEPTTRRFFPALTFLDLQDDAGGLLLLHAGHQYFKLGEDGVISNLAVREWESFFTGEYGWPRYSEFRHVLFPHGKEFDEAQCVRRSEEFSHKLIPHLAKSPSGTLPPRRSFLSLSPANVMLSAFYKTLTGYELRAIEIGGKETAAEIEFGVGVNTAAETNLMGRVLHPATIAKSRLRFTAKPWRVQSFAMK